MNQDESNMRFLCKSLVGFSAKCPAYYILIRNNSETTDYNVITTVLYHTVPVPPVSEVTVWLACGHFAKSFSICLCSGLAFSNVSNSIHKGTKCSLIRNTCWAWRRQPTCRKVTCHSVLYDITRSFGVLYLTHLDSTHFRILWKVPSPKMSQVLPASSSFLPRLQLLTFPRPSKTGGGCTLSGMRNAEWNRVNRVNRVAGGPVDRVQCERLQSTMTQWWRANESWRQNLVAKSCKALRLLAHHYIH